MNKQEFIEKLKMHGAWCTDCHDINGEKDRYVKFAKVRELLEQIDEPQAEKVEVPEFVAEWYESNKYKLERAIIDVACSMEKGEFPYNLPFEDWFIDPENHPIETLISMMKDGYTVKPKRWIVKYIPPFVDEFRYYSMDDEIFDITESSWTSDKEDAYPFPEKEKAEAVALLVDGSVEEV